MNSPIVQSAADRALYAIKNEMGERNRRSQRIGISLTSMKKAVKITRIKRRFKMNRRPQKFTLERFARLPARPVTTKRRKRNKRAPLPTRGRITEI